jgi:3-oxoacyl-[acyl-carrier protein] reductase
MNTLKNKVAMITGGSQGIGAAVSAALHAQGVRVAVVASSSVDKARSVASALDPECKTARPFAADVRNPAAVREAVAAVVRSLGPIDILVNCAGVFEPSPAGSTDIAVSDKMIDINLKGTWNVINAVAPQMRERKAGRIVNIASVAAHMGFGGYAVYCATKAGIVLMTRALACELAPLGINVNCVAPGNTATPMNEDIRTKEEMKGFLDFMAARTPSGRTYSSADDIAGGVVFLCSAAARAMHGSCLLMDEGFSAGM